MTFWYNNANPMVAWTTLATYRQERERGLVHSPEWDEQMTALDANLRAIQEDLRVIHAAYVARDEAARGAFPEAVV